MCTVTDHRQTGREREYILVFNTIRLRQKKHFVLYIRTCIMCRWISVLYYLRYLCATLTQNKVAIFVDFNGPRTVTNRAYTPLYVWGNVCIFFLRIWSIRSLAIVNHKRFNNDLHALTRFQYHWNWKKKKVKTILSLVYAAATVQQVFTGTYTTGNFIAVFLRFEGRGMIWPLKRPFRS